MKSTEFGKNKSEVYGKTVTSPSENEVEVIDKDELEEGFIPDVDLDSINLEELLSRMKEVMSDLDDDEDDDDSTDSDMDAEDYHNDAVDYARRSNYRKAAALCMEGLNKFPLNVDLLADIIKYSADAGDMECAAEYYALLKKRVPFNRWNWRAFTFSFDYLLQKDPVANEEDCRSIITTFRTYIPYEERADIAESELEDALGNKEESMNVLKNAIHSHAHASQCALRLADMQMKRGLYDDVIATTSYGIAASTEPQPSINVPYLYFLRTLAKDYFLHRKEYTGEAITRDEVAALKEEYALLLSEFPSLKHYADTIRTHVKMLKFVRTS